MIWYIINSSIIAKVGTVLKKYKSVFFFIQFQGPSLKNCRKNLSVWTKNSFIGKVRFFHRNETIQIFCNFLTFWVETGEQMKICKDVLMSRYCCFPLHFFKMSSHTIDFIAFGTLMLRIRWPHRHSYDDLIESDWLCELVLLDTWFFCDSRQFTFT